MVNTVVTGGGQAIDHGLWIIDHFKKTLVEPAITPLHFYYFPIFAQFVKTVLVPCIQLAIL
jgi:hypothetical protein